MTFCQQCKTEIPENYSYCPLCEWQQMNETIICRGCFNQVNKDQACKHSHTGNWYCSQCYQNLFLSCTRCGKEVARDDATYVNNEVYCFKCFLCLFVACYYCHEIVDRCDAYSDPDDNACCDRCFNSRFAICERCNVTFNRDELHRISHGWYCNDCRGFRGEWDKTEFFCSQPTYDIIGSTRKYGIELETHCCPDYETLRDDTIFGCKTDPSIEGKEFVSPILYGDQGLEIIDNFCKIARRLNWRVNRYCGYHVHLDISNESWESLQRIAYAYYLSYRLWSHFVSNNRVGNSFCSAPDYTHTDLLDIKSQEDWDYFVGQRDRFEFVNWRAYFAHSSVEIRNHDATLNTKAICNWIKVHSKFIDIVKTMHLNDIARKFGNNIESDFGEFSGIIGSELSDYYANVAENWGKPVLRQVVSVGDTSF